MEETTRKYRATCEVTDVVEAAGRTVVTALVSGTFAGSPAALRFAFLLEDGKIVHLTCG
jgi:hypothetical protein